jgi:hypothetical protein
VLLLPALASLACGLQAPEDPVERLLFDSTRAAAAQDADAVGAHLAGSFTGEGGLGRAESLSELRRYLSLYESIEIGTAGLELERSGADAVARIRVSLAGRPRQFAGLAAMLPETARFRFELTPVDEAGQLRVARAAWQRTEDP